MEYLELLKEIGPYILSTIAAVISFRAEKRVKPGLTEEAIVEKAEKKKEARVQKAEKKKESYLKKHLKNFQANEEKENLETYTESGVNSYEKLPEEVY